MPSRLSYKHLSGCKLFTELAVNAQTLFLLDISTWLSCRHLILSMSKITHYLPFSGLPVLLLPLSLTVPRHKTSVLLCSIHYSWSLGCFLCPYMPLGEFLVSVCTSASCCWHFSQPSRSCLNPPFWAWSWISHPSAPFVLMSIVFFS